MDRRRMRGDWRRKERGAALVEFAIVVVLLMVLVLGMCDWGLALKDYLALSQVAREAARQAAIGQMPDINGTTGLGYQFGLTPGNFTIESVTPAPASANKGDLITVQLAYNHEMILPLLWGMSTSMKSMGTQMVMRRE